MKDLLKEAIADAKAVRETALANAKLALEEAFTPRLQSMLSTKLAEEMEDDEMPEEEEMEVEKDPEMDSEMEDEEMPAEDEEPVSEDDDLDLDEIIRELEGADDEESMYEGEEGEHAMEEEDEDVDINEIIRSLREEDEDEEEEEEMATEEAEMEDSKELDEAYNVIRFLKDKINEVNLLNAKLLYSNKLFRNFTLNENQKMKVIENFDRAYSLREVKLVYSTLAESFKFPGTRKIVKESFASKPIASTKPGKRVISEGAELASRFKKLAGLSK